MNFIKILLLGFMAIQLGNAQEIVDPFAVNNGEIPSEKEYSGPLFKFKYDYPSEYIEPKDKTWLKVLKGEPLSKENAYEYIMALKNYIKDPMKTFLTEPEKWNKSSQEGWYSMLWAGEEVASTAWEGREAIYGTYTGQIIAKGVYANYGLKTDIRNHAAIYYDSTAAYTLHKVWEKCDKSKNECIPSVLNNEAQFKEGAIIIKSAGVTATPEEWPVLEGAAKWKIYRKPFNLNGTIKDAKPQVTDIRVGIFDIIVKDSVSAPETGWVFTTLVYDKDAKGDNTWDKMVPLGAMWGNDPNVNSAQDPMAELMETYINPNAPAWSTVTLGYGGRFSGPFDIAVKYNVEVDGKIVKSLRSSSCLGCHGTSSYIPDVYNMNTFFYPAYEHNGMPWKMYTPGSKEWNEWFQNRWGDIPQSRNKNAIALDYSTFLEAVLMNYAGAGKKIDEKTFEKYRKYRAYNAH